MSIDIQKWKAEAHENAAKTVANMLQVRKIRFYRFAVLQSSAAVFQQNCNFLSRLQESNQSSRENYFLLRRYKIFLLSKNRLSIRNLHFEGKLIHLEATALDGTSGGTFSDFNTVKLLCNVERCLYWGRV